jgi:hypothetical protein
MESVAYTFIQKYGWRITFEEAPQRYAGDFVDVTRDFSLGTRSYKARGGRLEFSYDLGPDAKPDPEQVLRTTVEAYHQAGLPGRYDIIRDGDYLHIVPTASANESGIVEPVRSPLDMAVTVDGAGRFPQPVLQDLARSIQATSGYRISLGWSPFYQGIQPRIERRFENIQARAILKALIAATGKVRIWYLMFDFSEKAYALSVL